MPAAGAQGRPAQSESLTQGYDGSWALRWFCARSTALKAGSQKYAGALADTAVSAVALSDRARRADTSLRPIRSVATTAEEMTGVVSHRVSSSEGSAARDEMFTSPRNGLDIYVVSIESMCVHALALPLRTSSGARQILVLLGVVSLTSKQQSWTDERQPRLQTRAVASDEVRQLLARLHKRWGGWRVP